VWVRGIYELGIRGIELWIGARGMNQASVGMVLGYFGIGRVCSFLCEKMAYH
jgi:hypothetical protein